MVQSSFVKKQLAYTVFYDYLRYSVVFLMFCVPLGPSMKSIGIVTALVSLLLLPECREHLQSAYTKSFFVAPALLMMVVALSCFWSIANPHNQLVIFEKYIKLLFIPLLALGFQQTRIRHLALHAFLVGMSFVCILSFVKLLILHLPEPDKIFNNHIQTGFMMVFASYLANYFWIRSKEKWQWIYGVMSCSFAFQILFISNSRTAYILYAMLVLFFVFQFASVKIMRKKLLLGMLGYGFLLGMTGLISMTHFDLSNNIKQRTNDVLIEVHQYQKGQKNTGIGYRFQFHEYAKSLFLTKPILGHGIGSFDQRYYMDTPISNWQGHPDAHSQFWLIATEFGVIGILVLIGFFSNLFLISMRLCDMKLILQALLLLFIVGSFTECVLVNSAIGYFFITLIAMCLGEYLELSKTESIYLHTRFIFPRI